MKITILAYENCTASMIVGLVDILSLANIQHGKNLFDIRIVTLDGQPVRSFTSFPIPPDGSFKSKSSHEYIYVPGFLGDMDQVIRDCQKNIAWLKKQYDGGTKMLAACNGNVLLAEAGILDHKSATTHWSLKTAFKSRYPKVDLKPEKIIVDAGDVISAAGVTAYMNLALYIVARFGSMELASYCSKVFLVDSGRKVQTPYLTFSTPKNHGDAEITRVQDWIEGNYKKSMPIESITDVASMSRRTLIRRFKKATGESPLEYLQQIRIENAKRALETTDKTFAEITWDVGYNDISSFQRLFKMNTHLTPREYRNKFTLLEAN